MIKNLLRDVLNFKPHARHLGINTLPYCFSAKYTGVYYLVRHTAPGGSRITFPLFPPYNFKEVLETKNHFFLMVLSVHFSLLSRPSGNPNKAVFALWAAYLRQMTHTLLNLLEVLVRRGAYDITLHTFPFVDSIRRLSGEWKAFRMATKAFGANNSPRYAKVFAKQAKALAHFYRRGVLPCLTILCDQYIEYRYEKKIPHSWENIDNVMRPVYLFLRQKARHLPEGLSSYLDQILTVIMLNKPPVETVRGNYDLFDLVLL